MKILILSDIHGRTFWQEFDFWDYDEVVFVGDYLDSYNISGKAQIENLENLIDARLPNVTFLAGNHCYHYLFGWEFYSGYQAKIAFKAKKLLKQMDLKIAYLHENYLITHAGVTKTWFNTLPKIEGNVAEVINQVWTYKPKMFMFNGKDPYGDNITQGPLWVRPKSLMKDGLDYHHIVGHTFLTKPYTENNFSFIDCPYGYTEIVDDELNHYPIKAKDFKV